VVFFGGGSGEGGIEGTYIVDVGEGEGGEGACVFGHFGGVVLFFFSGWEFRFGSGYHCFLRTKCPFSDSLLSSNVEEVSSSDWPGHIFRGWQDW